MQPVFVNGVGRDSGGPALAALLDLKQTVQFLPLMTERLFLCQNANVRNLPTTQVSTHPVIRYAIRIGLGEIPGGIEYTGVPYPVQDRISKYLS